MGQTKSELFSETQNELAALAKALAHPARIAILEHVLQAKQCITNDLVLETGLAQATVSQHLKELKQVGILKGSVEGTSICYCIDTDTWEKIGARFAELFRSSVTDTTGNCC